ncbi:nucleotidyl transferase AbiEii/AbiGii toxin family protein [Methylophilus sp. OH31]|uniref:nucleotidyl transferase AbiEii/AbiGii toxin family protein n=1 Tax=Methylophilus sp. OH31 TaxID=1387312 RepID=UPI00046692D4|nr:nucleotidyl transferase AbiEii/AbiGii toxin family protein [Methylophilus sp. OH31]
MFYLDLFKQLNQYHVQYLLIGGLAISMHGIERATMDIDITIAMNPENQKNLILWAESLNLKPVLPVPLQSLRDIALLKQWQQERNLLAFALTTPEVAGVTIDILLFPPVDFIEMQQRATHFDIDQIDIPVASIDDLISLKQAAGRPIDLSDIDHLKRLKR